MIFHFVPLFQLCSKFAILKLSLTTQSIIVFQINYANLKSMNDMYLNAKTGDVTKKYINFFCGLCMRRFNGIPSSIVGF